MYRETNCHLQIYEGKPVVTAEGSGDHVGLYLLELKSA